VGPRAGLDDLDKRKFLTLPGLELRPISRPAGSESLYRLSYVLTNNIWCQQELRPRRPRKKSRIRKRVDGHSASVFGATHIKHSISTSSAK
jgi:hypothetical protein